MTSLSSLYNRPRPRAKFQIQCQLHLQFQLQHILITSSIDGEKLARICSPSSNSSGQVLLILNLCSIPLVPPIASYLTGFPQSIPFLNQQLPSFPQSNKPTIMILGRECQNEKKPNRKDLEGKDVNSGGMS